MLYCMLGRRWGMMDEMRKEPPIVEYAFSWGKMLRLYPDYLDVNGTHYPLSKLTFMRPIYQHVMGISSVRLELYFGKQKVVLRGIAALGDAQKTLEYLKSHYLDLDHTQSNPGASAAHTQTRSYTQASRDEAECEPVQQVLDPATRIPADQQAEPDHVSELVEQPEATHRIQLEQEAELEQTPLSRQELYVRERAQAPTAKVVTPNWQRFRQDQRERRLKRIQIARSLREYGFDVDELAQRLNEDALPEISVPLRLLPGEHAHYSTDATLCGEPIGNALRYTYPARDHGTLILTNKRLVYIGRRSQIVLDYIRLSHVSRLRGAIALQAEHWYRREIFEVRRSLECLMHLEVILKRFQREQEFEAITYSYLNDEEQREETTTPIAALSTRSQVKE